MEKEPEIIRTSLRLPKGLYDKIADIASRHGQTMHAEILAMLNSATEVDTIASKFDADSHIEPSNLLKARQMLDEVGRLIERAEKASKDL